MVDKDKESHVEKSTVDQHSVKYKAAQRGWGADCPSDIKEP